MLFVESMVDFFGRLQFHPHASFALIESHMDHTIVDVSAGAVEPYLFFGCQILLSELGEYLVSGLLLLNFKLLIVVL